MAPLPPDVRLMNATAAALRHRRRDPGRRDGGDVARAPAVLRDPLDQRRRRRRPQQRLDDPRQRGAASSPATSSPWTCARSGAPSSRCRGCAWRSCDASGRIACASSSRSIGRSRSGAARAAPRSSSTASARSSRPTSATSRTTTCRRSPGPTAARRTCWRCSARVDAGLAPLGARVEALAAVGPRLVAGDARHRRRRRARPRQRRRRPRPRGALRHDGGPGDVALPAARSNTPTCATATATRCA